MSQSKSPTENLINIESESSMITDDDNDDDDKSSTCENDVEEYTSLVTKTKYEQLVEAIPLSEEDAKIVIAGGQLGLLHETLALQAIQHTKLSPLLTYKDETKNDACRKKYYHEAEPGDNGMSRIIANLSAFLNWDYAWNYRRRVVTRQQYESLSNKTMDSAQDCRVWKWTPEVLKSHAEWCQKREINPNNVRVISDTIDATMNVLFETRFEPEWLKCTDPTPLWRRFGSWRGEMDHHHLDMMWRVYGKYDAPLLCDTLRALCDSGGNVQTAMMQALEIVATKGDWKPCDVGLKQRPVEQIQQFISRNKALGKFVKWNACTTAKPSPKNFLQGTRSKGGNYVFLHDPDTLGVVNVEQYKGNSWDGFAAIAPVVSSLTLFGGASNWFARKAEHLLLMGEGNFEFTEALCTMGYPPLISSTIDKTAPQRPRPRRNLLKRVFAEAKVETRRMTSLDATRVHRYAKIQTRMEAGEIRTCAWNFPCKGKQVSDSIHQDMILSTFSSLAAVYDQSMDYDFPVVALHPFLFGITLHQEQFSRWFVLRSALRTGWRLRAWCPFDHDVFPGYHPCHANGEHMEIENARFYVFQYMYCNVL